MHSPNPFEKKLYGTIAQFDTAEDLVQAAREARAAGYTKLEAYTPYAIEGLVDELGNRDDRVPWIVFICGMLGAALGFTLQWWVTNVDYPMNVGGRPNLSWPSFIPITFECGVLSASIGGVIGMLMLNGLPRPHHPIFDAENIELATQNKFFLCLENDDPMYTPESARDFFSKLETAKVESVSEVIS